MSVSSIAWLCRAKHLRIFKAEVAGVGLPHPPEGFTFRELRAEDFRCGALFQVKNRAPQFERMVRSGHRCFGLVTEAGEAVAYLWLSSPRFGTPIVPFEFGLACRIPDDAAYIWDCRVHPDYRNRGLYRFGLNSLLALVAESGAAVALIASEAVNAPSNAAIVAAGFAAQYAVTIIRLPLGLEFIAAHGRIMFRRPGGVIPL